MRRFLAPLLLTLIAACAADTSSPPIADHFEIVQGGAQTGAYGRSLDTPLVVRVVDDRGGAVVGAAVAWSALSGGGSVSTITSTTGVDGLVAARWTLGVDPQDQVIRLASPGISSLDISATVSGLRATAVAVTGAAACALDDTGKVWCWGAHPWYESSSTYGSTPVAIDSVHAFTSITGGIDHFCALTAAGEAWCWGIGSRGELGTGSAVSSTLTPVQVAGGHTFTTIAASWYTTCAIDPAGQAWCWGTPGDGDLGTGSVSEMAPAPVQQGAVSFVSISLGYEHICALEVTGQAWCWGHQDVGQLGDSIGGSAPFPQKVAGTTLFRSVTAGDHFSCGIAMNSSLWCWGTPELAPYSAHLTPAQVDGGGFGRILGDEYFMVGERNHRLVAAGSSWYTGAPPEIGTYTLTEIPGGLTGITDIALRWATICMVRSDESVFCAGDVPGFGLTASPVGIPAP